MPSLNNYLTDYNEYQKPCRTCNGFNPLTCQDCDSYINTLTQWLGLDIPIEQKFKIKNSLTMVGKYWKDKKDKKDKKEVLEDDGLFT